MTFTAAHLEAILAANWPVAARLIAWARALAGQAAETLPKHTLLEARRILRPAESFIRRLIVIMACRLELPEAASCARPGAHVAGPAPTRPARSPSQTLGVTEPIRFSTEPFPQIAAFTYPGIWSPGQVRYTLPSPEALAAAPMPASAFFARLARLEAVLAAPDAAALRLARWLARQKAALKQSARPVRTSPVQPWGLMPGRASTALDTRSRDRMAYTAWGAAAALHDGAWNTS